MKKFIWLLTAACLLTLLVGCAREEPIRIIERPKEEQVEDVPVTKPPMPVDKEADDAITEAIISQFEEMTRIPRPSKHEDRISQYLYNWAATRGFDPFRDANDNVIFDVPATEGMEKKPMVGLQVHMDMVFAQEEGAGLDPLSTPITMQNDGKVLTAEGTSLGADDGIGIATVLCIAEGKMDHGPLRIIITTDEETSMGGATSLDPKEVSELEYLINVDYENEGRVAVSSAAATVCTCTRTCTKEAPALDSALSITLSELSGGHSGERIQENHLNAILAISHGLRALYNNNIEFELASYEGGDANNAIPTFANAVICVNAGDAKTAKAILTDCFNLQLSDYKAADPNGTFSIKNAEMPESIMSREDRNSIINYLELAVDGVITMSKDLPDLVQTSSNLGVIRADPEEIRISGMCRSSDSGELTNLVNTHRNTAAKCDLEFASEQAADAWKYDPNSRLLSLTKDAYLNRFGHEITVEATHCGLECGTFLRFNPVLDVISIGPTVRNAHTVNEACEIETLPKVWNLLADVLAAI